MATAVALDCTTPGTFDLNFSGTCFDGYPQYVASFRALRLTGSWDSLTGNSNITPVYDYIRSALTTWDGSLADKNTLSDIAIDEWFTGCARQDEGWAQRMWNSSVKDPFTNCRTTFCKEYPAAVNEEFYELPGVGVTASVAISCIIATFFLICSLRPHKLDVSMPVICPIYRVVRSFMLYIALGFLVFIAWKHPLPEPENLRPDIRVRPSESTAVNNVLNVTISSVLSTAFTAPGISLTLTGSHLGLPANHAQASLPLMALFALIVFWTSRAEHFGPRFGALIPSDTLSDDLTIAPSHYDCTKPLAYRLKVMNALHLVLIALIFIPMLVVLVRGISTFFITIGATKEREREIRQEQEKVGSALVGRGEGRRGLKVAFWVLQILLLGAMLAQLGMLISTHAWMDQRRYWGQKSTRGVRYPQVPYHCWSPLQVVILMPWIIILSICLTTLMEGNSTIENRLPPGYVAIKQDEVDQLRIAAAPEVDALASSPDVEGRVIPLGPLSSSEGTGCVSDPRARTTAASPPPYDENLQRPPMYRTDTEDGGS